MLWIKFATAIDIIVGVRYSMRSSEFLNNATITRKFNSVPIIHWSAIIVPAMIDSVSVYMKSGSLGSNSRDAKVALSSIQHWSKYTDEVKLIRWQFELQNDILDIDHRAIKINPTHIITAMEVPIQLQKYLNCLVHFKCKYSKYPLFTVLNI